MEYLLFILICVSITEFITQSTIGLFIREHPLIKCDPYRPYFIPLTIKEMIYDILHCSMCFGFWIGICIAFVFEYYNVNLILLNTLFGPTFYGFIASFTSYRILQD